MSRIFYAVHRETGERWKKDTSGIYKHQYLVLYDSGHLAVVSEIDWEGSSIVPLDRKKWKIMFNK